MTGKFMPEKSDSKPRRLYADAVRETTGKSVDPEEKAKDAQELRQLAKEFKNGIRAHHLMTPEIRALLEAADAAMDAEEFEIAGRFLSQVSKIIESKHIFGNRFRSFGLDGDLPAFVSKKK